MLCLCEDHHPAYQGDITQARFGAFLDFKPFGAAECAVDIRQVEADSKSRAEVVTQSERADGTVPMLVRGVADFGTFLLECRGMGELLGKTDMKSAAAFSARGAGIIDCT